MRMWRCANQNDNQGNNSHIGKKAILGSSARGERTKSLYMESDKDVKTITYMKIYYEKYTARKTYFT